MESESENLKFKQKCKDLKNRIGEIDENNQVITIAISRSKLAIKRLRLEYAILLERLERKSLASVADTTEAYSQQVASPELPSLKLNELNPISSGRRGKAGGARIKMRPKERDPKLPKRPTNSYLIFCELEKDKIKQRLDATSPPGYLYDMSKALTEAWKNLNEEDKKPYYKLYEEEKERYSKELKIYNDEKNKEAAEAAEKEKTKKNGDDKVKSEVKEKSKGKVKQEESEKKAKDEPKDESKEAVKQEPEQEQENITRDSEKAPQIAEQQLEGNEDIDNQEGGESLLPQAGKGEEKEKEKDTDTTPSKKHQLSDLLDNGDDNGNGNEDAPEAKKTKLEKQETSSNNDSDNKNAAANDNDKGNDIQNSSDAGVDSTEPAVKSEWEEGDLLPLVAGYPTFVDIWV